MFRLIILTSVVIGCCTASLPKDFEPILDSRIVGGEDATIQEFPHQVSMRYFGRHWCGGSIISERVIITAAHCVFGKFQNDITVNVGSTYRTKGGRKYAIEKIVVHEGYNKPDKGNDIALLFLSESLEFSDEVKPIVLPQHNETVSDGVSAIVSGWGTVLEGYPLLPDILKYVKVNVINNKICDGIYRIMGRKITDQMLCAMKDEGVRGSCHGDSGGPLVSGGKLIGVVSWGFRCGLNFPGVYANVSEFRKWIEEKANL